MSRVIAGPFNRIEGDLEVTLDIESGVIERAEVNATLFRGFEAMLLGRPASDLLVYAPRICGICSISQSYVAATALSKVCRVEPPPNGRLIQNILLANENAADHLTHFYLFFMPDFAQEDYVSQSWYARANKRFKAGQGEAQKAMLKVRAQWLKMQGLLAGHWPHSLVIQPGGVSQSVDDEEIVTLIQCVRQLKQFLENELLGDTLESFQACQTEDAFNQWLKQPAVKKRDLGLFCEIAEHVNLRALGQTQVSLMSYGSYPESSGSGQRHYSPGVFANGKLSPLKINQVTEDVTHARYSHPEQTNLWDMVTAPSLDRAQSYTWAKAPRLGGQVMEVGAMARQILTGQPLVSDLHATYGSNVYTRVIGRVVELVDLVLLVETWLKQIEVTAPYCHDVDYRQSGQVVSLIEAARGALGYWVAVDKGKITQLQIIAPTTWNFSPKDAQGQNGALEQALRNTVVGKAGAQSPCVQHIIRSFDPCMVCTAH